MVVYESSRNKTDALYVKYIRECVRTREFTVFKESELDEGIKEVWNFIKELATSAALKIGDLARALKNKDIFTFFASFNFDPKKIGEAFKGVYELIKKVTQFIPGNVAKILQTGIDKLSPEHKKIIIDGVTSIDRWLKGRGKFGNAIFACFIIWLWFEKGLTGDIFYDFDMADPLGALSGKLAFANFFLGDNGNLTNKDGKPVKIIKYLGQIITKSIGLGLYLPFAKAGKVLFLATSLIKFLAKEAGISIGKGNNTDNDLEKAKTVFT